MRFGRRSRNPFSWRKQPKSSPDENDQHFTPVASEERDALLGTPPAGQEEDLDDVDNVSSEHSEGEDQISLQSHLDTPIDPTQKLLTALGRFQRQVARAREGQPQEVWAEECMNHLITAVEIALDQGWRELVTALTETARILQSYEDAGKANDAATFLADSNELLCLMVGDLIVGRIRPGVVEKWRQRYERAVQELAASGIPLVTDEEDTREEMRAEENAPASTVEAYQQNVIELATREPERSEEFEEGREESVVGDIPAVPTEDIADAVGDLDELDRAVESLIESYASGGSVESPSTVRSEREEADLSLAELAPEEEPSATLELAARRHLPEEVALTLDALCEDLAKVAEAQGAGVSLLLERVEEDLEELEAVARDHGWRVLESPCQRFRSVLREVKSLNIPADDRFLEIAYAFCGLYGESTGAGADDAEIESWLQECEEWLEEKKVSVFPPETETSEIEEGSEAPETSVGEEMRMERESIVLEEPTATTEVSVSEEVVKAPIEDRDMSREMVVPAVTPAEEAPDLLLNTAREAFATGDVAQAKRFALEAAAKLAAVQVREAEEMVERAEERTKRDAAIAEQLRLQIQNAEREVGQSEQRVIMVRNELDSVQARTSAVEQTIRGIDEEIHRIEEEIRKLQEERAAALGRRKSAEAQLEEAQAEVERVEATLESERQNERQARSQLEELRQQVKTPERRRAEDDALLEKTRELLNKRRISLAEIEETIKEISDTETSAIDTDGLPFQVEKGSEG